MKLFPAAACILLVLGTISIASAQEDHPPMSEPGDGYKTLNLGNSLVGQLHVQYEVDGKKGKGGLLPFLAQQMGYEGHEGVIVGAAGVPLDWLWNNPGKRQEFRDHLEKQQWEMLTAMPFGWQNRRNVVDEAGGAAAFYRILLEQNPEAPLLIYQTWPSGREAGGAHHPDLGGAFSEGSGDTELYVKGLQMAIDEYMNPVAHVLRQEFPENPVYIVPVPQVFIELHKRMKENNGEYAGIKHMAEILDSGGTSVHVSRKGLWINAMTHLAAYYRENPAEKEIPHDYKNLFAFSLQDGMLESGLTEEQADTLAQMAWEVVSNTPATPVTREPFQFEDMEKPSKPGNIQAELAGPTQARISWEAATDNTEIKTYGVYRNKEFITMVAPDADLQHLVTALQPGEENTLSVRAFDPTFNYSEASTTVSPSVIEGEPLLSWNLSKYTHRTKLREQDVDDENLAADQSAEGVQTEATVTRGKGIKAGDGPFFNAVDLSDITSGSLADAVAEDDFLTVTIKPTEGKTLSLSALAFPLKVAEGGSVAVMSSTKGFEAGKEIAKIENLPNGNLDSISFDLSEVQDASEPVELRIYFFGANRTILLGRPNAGTADDVMDMILYGTVK